MGYFSPSLTPLMTRCVCVCVCVHACVRVCVHTRASLNCICESACTFLCICRVSLFKKHPPTNLSCVLLFFAAYNWICLCKCVLCTLVHVYSHSVGAVYMHTAKASLTAVYVHYTSVCVWLCTCTVIRGPHTICMHIRAGRSCHINDVCHRPAHCVCGHWTDLQWPQEPQRAVCGAGTAQLRTCGTLFVVTDLNGICT